MVNRDINSAVRMMIVDDEADIREILGLILSETFTCDLTEFSSSKSAIEYLKQNPDAVDMIISDFGMPNGNGDQIEQIARDLNARIPFLLVTGEDKKTHSKLLLNENRYYLQKPFRANELQSLVKKMIENNEGLVLTGQEYVPISMNTLLQVKDISCSLFVKLGNNHYVRVINEGSVFDQAAFDRLSVKKVSHLYIEKEHLNDLMGDYRTQAMNKMYLRLMKERPQELLQLSQGAKELLVVAAKTMNWSQDLQKIGNDNVKMVQNIVSSDTELNSVFTWFSDSEAHELGVASGFFMTYLLVALTNHLEQKDPGAIEKLTLAAFFHDMALDEYHILNQAQFLNALKLGSPISKSSLDVIHKHPERATAHLRAWRECPAEVLTIIDQHHELPDGSGFPKGLKEEEIHPLAKIFIVAIEINEIFQRHRNKKSVYQELLKKRSSVFSRGVFYNYITIIIDQLKESGDTL